MSPFLVGIIGIVILLIVLFILGTPVAFALGIVGFCGFWHLTSFNASMSMVGSNIWATFSKYGLTVIPLFIFMGQIAFHSEVNKRLYNAAYTWFGQLRGGLAMATVVACAMFSAICGSNAATAATMTTVAQPEMKKYNYNSMMSTGAIACGSTLGVVIPPSVALIVIGIYTGNSIAKLFYGAIPAGILLTFMFMLTIYILCCFKNNWGPIGNKTTFKDKIRALPGAFEMVTLFILVMLGLYVGFFTPSEAGAAGAFTALFLSIIERRLSWKGFLNAILDTLRISCMVIMIVTGAVIFGKFLAVTRLPYDLANWVHSLAISKILIMLIIFLIYAIGGAVMDALALLLITIPIFFPIVTQLGYDPIWFGVAITLVTTLGAVTPPVGVTTYIVGAISEGTSIQQVFKGVSFFMPAYIISVLILLFFPQIITYLPQFVH